MSTRCSILIALLACTLMPKGLLAQSTQPTTVSNRDWLQRERVAPAKANDVNTSLAAALANYRANPLSIARGETAAAVARRESKLNDFCAAVNTVLNDTKCSGDQRAIGFLLLAYAEEIKGETPSPLAGKTWIDRALAAAESDGIRRDCLEYLVIREAEARCFHQASSILKSNSDLFASESDRFQDLGRWIDSAERVP
jgi:hypothetical protein